MEKMIWEDYTNCWSEADTQKRRENLEALLMPACLYYDKNIKTTGPNELSLYMESFQKKFPMAKFVTVDFRGHHAQSLAYWNLVDKNGSIIGHGASYATYEGNRLKMISGFFEL